jgi:hypothetical protein
MRPGFEEAIKYSFLSFLYFLFYILNREFEISTKIDVFGVCCVPLEGDTLTESPVHSARKEMKMIEKHRMRLGMRKKQTTAKRQ